MILPGSSLYSILLLVLGLVCWGLWANTFKATGKWRFELFGFDFAFGMVLASLLAALTLGSMGWDGFSFLDDVRNAGKRQDLFAFLAGALFNLGNLLLLGAISMSGLSVAIPVGMGLALVIEVIWAYALHPAGSPVVLGLGGLSVAVSVVLAAVAYKLFVPMMAREELAASPSKNKKVKKVSTTKGLVVAAIAGLLIGSYSPLIDNARDSDVGLGPYSLAFIFSLGVLVTTVVYNLFLMNLPLKGDPVDFGTYLKGNVQQHCLGMLGGALWAIGAVAFFVAARTEGPAHPGPAVTYATEHGAIALAAICGFAFWKEFSDADARIKTLLFIMFIFLATGIGAISVAPTFSALR